MKQDITFAEGRSDGHETAALGGLQISGLARGS